MTTSAPKLRYADTEVLPLSSAQAALLTYSPDHAWSSG